jgi:hypothetical protein
MKRFQQIVVGLVMLTGAPLWSQVEATPAQIAQTGTSPENVVDHSSDRMLAPPPVSGQNYPTQPTSEERANYLRGGVTFTSAYADNAVGAVDGHPVSDVSYSVAPTIALDETTSRMHSIVTYAPGFTFYQRESSRNEADQNASIDFTYRLSPHVTFSARDGFQKTSNIFNQPDTAYGATVSGGAQEANFSVIAPIADVLRNSGNAGLTYQFARNAMIGGSGSFSNLHYSDSTQVPGLYDSSSQGGSAFYSLRISQVHYVGATYQYQRLASYPTGGLNETQTHALLFFYTLYPTSRLSLSFFGGPQHSDTAQAAQASLQLPSARAWSPAAGASLNWQGRFHSAAVSYSHIISGGGGLIGAVHMDTAAASLRRQVTKSLSGSLGLFYAQNDLLGATLPGAASGHTLSGTASLQQQFRQRFTLQLGYTRLHQDYSNVAVLSLTPDTNREFISVSYQFSRPLGR